MKRVQKAIKKKPSENEIVITKIVQSDNHSSPSASIPPRPTRQTRHHKDGSVDLPPRPTTPSPSPPPSGTRPTLRASAPSNVSNQINNINNTNNPNNSQNSYSHNLNNKTTLNRPTVNGESPSGIPKRIGGSPKPLPPPPKPSVAFNSMSDEELVPQGNDIDAKNSPFLSKSGSGLKSRLSNKWNNRNKLQEVNSTLRKRGAKDFLVPIEAAADDSGDNHSVTPVHKPSHKTSKKKKSTEFPLPPSINSGALNENIEQNVLAVEDVVEDSPQTRAKVKGLLKEERSCLSKRVTKTLKVLGTIEKKGKSLSAQYDLLGEELLDLSNELAYQDPLLSQTFEQIGKALAQLEQIRQGYHDQLESVFITPMQRMVDTELIAVKEVYKKVESTQKQCDAVHSRLSSLGKKEEAKYPALLEEYRLAEDKVLESHMNLMMELYELRCKKKIDYLTSLSSTFSAQVNFYQQTAEASAQLKTHTQNVAEHLQKQTLLYQNQKQDIMNKRFTHETNRLQNKKREQDIDKRWIEQNLQNSSDLFSTEQSFSLLSSPSNAQSIEISTTKESTISGYLMQRSTSKMSPGTHWNKKFFAVRGGMIIKYDCKSKGKQNSQQPLILCTTRDTRDPHVTDQRRFCFELITPRKSFLLQAATEREKQEWLTVIRNSQCEQLNNGGAGGSPAQNVDNSELCNRLNAINGNGVCADCGDSGPTWASINLGVLICIECSGIHRSLGVHITKVRSLTLDRFDDGPENLRVLERIGNSHANQVFEHQLRQNSKPVLLKPNSLVEKRRQWIRMKYEFKKWVGTIPEPDMPAKITELFDALHTANFDTLYRLLAQGVSANCTNLPDNSSPLHILAKATTLAPDIEEDLAALLLLNGGRDVPDTDGMTALHHAAVHGKAHLAVMLLRKGFSTSAKTKQGDTPLALATTHGKKDLQDIFKRSPS